MVKLKRLHQNRSFSIKCSCFGCGKPALTYFACGIVKDKPKKAYINKTKRLFRVSLKEDVAVPMCLQHLKILEQYLKEIKAKK
jgi:hypothetical protein